MTEKEAKMKELGKYLYAHRGLHHKPDAPENSLAAFRRAVDSGYGAELDVHLLRDGTLAVLHDSTLKRMTGQGGIIEDLTAEDLPSCVLGKSRETIPTFAQVLEVFGGKTPLIVELKPWGGNDAELSEKACRMLESYPGLYCVESFSPYVVRWLKKNRPEVVRGQLAMNYFREKNRSGLNVWQAVVCTNLLHGFLTRPDFVAYRFKDRGNAFNQFCLKRLGRQGAAWTIRQIEDLEQARAEGLWVIFESFVP